MCHTCPDAFCAILAQNHPAKRAEPWVALLATESCVGIVVIVDTSVLHELQKLNKCFRCLISRTFLKNTLLYCHNNMLLHNSHFFLEFRRTIILGKYYDHRGPGQWTAGPPPPTIRGRGTVFNRLQQPLHRHAHSQRRQEVDQGEVPARRSREGVPGAACL